MSAWCAHLRKRPTLKPPRPKSTAGAVSIIVAHGKDILRQFLIEAAALSSSGGIIGILLGITTSKIVSGVTHWPSLIPVSSIVVSLLVSTAVGIFFGFYPARKAAQLDPIEALRIE